MVTIMVIDEKTEKLKVGSKVEVSQIVPAFPMQQSIKLKDYLTDISGIVKVALDSNKEYNVMVSGKDTTLGFTILRKERLKDSQLIIIKVFSTEAKLK